VAGEGSILLPVIHDVLGKGRPKTADIHQQMLGGGVKVDANEVDAALDGLIQRMFEFRLVYIVLILSHANALGVDLDQFSQRVHKSAAYGDSTADSDILIRELVAGNLRGGIDRGPIFTDCKDLRFGRLILFLGIDIVAASQDILDEIIGFAAGCSITDGDGFDLVFLNHLLNGDGRLGALVDRRVGEDGFMMEQITLCIEANHLTTSTESRVDAHDPFLTKGCTKQ